MEVYSKEKFINLNKNMKLRYLFSFAQSIEKYWEDTPHRVSQLETLKRFLETLGNENDSELKSLGKLVDKFHSDMSLKHFIGIIVPLERKYVRGVCDDDILTITKIDGEDPKNRSTVPLYIVLDNLRSAFNVGAIFRTAECLGVKKIFLCGYTATPDNEKMRKTTMGTHDFVEWEWVRSADEVISKLNSEGVHTVALETVADSPSIYDIKLPQPCALLLGNEKHGLEKSLLKQVNQIAHIPVYGMKNSLNVGIAFGVCGFEIRRQWKI